jgi:hypothetical protein
MEVDQDLQDQGTPPGPTFDDDFPPTMTGGYTKADLAGRVHTDNSFTPLYTESQETDPTNINANQRRQTPAATNDVDMTVDDKKNEPRTS